MRRWWLIILSAIVVFVVAVVPFENSFRLVAAQMPAQETHQLNELASSLLAYPSPTIFFQQKLKVQLLPGQLPSVPPLSLPVPPSGRLVGSAVYRLNNEEIAFVDILLQVPEPAEDVMSFYKRSLVGIGWKMEQSQALPPGFHDMKIGEFPVVISQNFCQEKLTQAWQNLSVGVFSPKDEPNNVRISLVTQALKKKLGVNYSVACDRPSQPERSEQVNASNLLPSLSAPEGVDLQTTGSCGRGASDASISTVAKTNKDAVELEAAIASQLESAGWKRLTAHAEKSLAWSIWLLPAPGKWQGVLLAIQSPQQNQYLISVQVTSQEKLSSP
jgi:hypothetical protein